MRDLLPWIPLANTLVVVALVAWRRTFQPLVPVRIPSQPTYSDRNRSC